MKAQLAGGPWDGYQVDVDPCFVVVMATDRYRMRPGSHFNDHVVVYEYQPPADEVPIREGQPVTLTEFLTARLDEDETSWSMNHTVLSERVLREVTAKRRILAAYERAAARDDLNDPHAERYFTLEEAVAILAVVYVDHPDYDPAWR